MSDGTLEVQAALLGALNGNLDDMQSPAVNVPVFDYVQQDTSPIYVTIGEVSMAASDVKTANGIEHTVEINVYSIHRGVAEVKYVLNQIYTLLHGVRLSIAGFDASDCRFVQSAAFRDGENGAAGVATYAITTVPE